MATRSFVALALAGTLALLAGCGGGSDDSTSATTQAAGDDTTAPEPNQGSSQNERQERAPGDAGGERKNAERRQSDKRRSQDEPSEQEVALKPPPRVAHDDSGGGVKQFFNKGSDNSIQESGTEASDSLREEAAVALHGFLDSGVRRDWEGACYYVSKEIYEQVATTFRMKGMPCPDVLQAFFQSVSVDRFRLAAVADVGSFRVEGDRGFLLYHAAENVDRSIPMVFEEGRWKVAALGGGELL